MSENAELKRTIEAMKKDQTRFKMLLVRYEDLVSKRVFRPLWGPPASFGFRPMRGSNFWHRHAQRIGVTRLRESVQSSVEQPSSSPPDVASLTLRLTTVALALQEVRL